MEFKDLFKTKWKSDFSGKTCCFLLILSMLTLLAWADKADKIKKLSVKCQAGDKEACVKLADIAKNDKDSNVGCLAMGKLTDQVLLADIVKNGENSWVRYVAVGKLTDQAILADIAKNNKDSTLREKAVETITDQALLAEIAIEDNHWLVRQHAIKNPNLTDQAVLAEAAIMDKENCWEALEKLTDQSLISQVAIEAEKRLQEEAMGKLPPESRDSLINAARLRREKVENLSDQTVLINIALNDKDYSNRLIAVKKISSQDTFAKIAKTDKDIYVCLAAIEKLTDQSILADIVKKNHSFLLRLAAVKKLTDQSYLADITTNNPDLPLPLRRTAASMLEDQTFIEKVIRNDPGLMPILEVDLSGAINAISIDFKGVKKSPVATLPGNHSLGISISFQTGYFNGPIMASGHSEITFIARAGNTYYIDTQISDTGTQKIMNPTTRSITETTGKSWNPIVRVMKDELDYFLDYEMHISYRHIH